MIPSLTSGTLTSAAPLAVAEVLEGLPASQANLVILAVGAAALYLAYESTRAAGTSASLLITLLGIVVGGAVGWLATESVATTVFSGSVFLVVAAAANVFTFNRDGELWAWAILATIGVVAIGVMHGLELASFVAFAGIVLFGALKVITVDELVHATVYLAATLFGVAGLFLTLGAQFLAMIQILVYVGAVITLFLFTVMLTVPRAERVVLDDLDLPLGLTIERVEDLNPANPHYGAGPMKGFKKTNPRKPVRPPTALTGLTIDDNEFGSETTIRRKAQKPAEDNNEEAS